MQQIATPKETKKVFINRELSWLDFNRRVLMLSQNESLPLAERLKFASIFGSNLDEFFMVRVGSLFDQAMMKNERTENKTGYTAAQQIELVQKAVTNLQPEVDKTVRNLERTLSEYHLTQVDLQRCTKKQERYWKKYFMAEILPLLSPQIIDRRHPFPFLRGLEIYVGVWLKTKGGLGENLAVIPLGNQFSKVIFSDDGEGIQYLHTEHLVSHFLDLLFDKKEIRAKGLFRVTRNADLSMEQMELDEADADYRLAVEDLLKKRRKLAAVRLQLDESTPVDMEEFLRQNLLLEKVSCYRQACVLDLTHYFAIFSKLQNAGYHGLFYKPQRPSLPLPPYDLAKVAERQDVLLHYPYQSMRPFIEMLEKAAADPEVVSIKMTLYRLAPESKIVQALIKAAEAGKEVVAVVELRATFDEQNNIQWSKELENAGCNVFYGFEDYKIHAKLLLITKKAKNGKSQYLGQIGTGNFNERTAELYTDLALLTSDQKVCEDIAHVFQNLSLGEHTSRSQTLMVAPYLFKSEMLRLIDWVIEAKGQGKSARIVLKCNSMSDKDIMTRLMVASKAGVPVDLIIRGVCCLKAPVAGETDNIRIHSLVGRYLEHARIYLFTVEDEEQMYIGSGDLLTRNTENRVETLVRIEDDVVKRDLKNLLDAQLKDNVNAFLMQPDGSYQKVQALGERPRDSQEEMYETFYHAWPRPDMEQSEAGWENVRPTSQSGGLFDWILRLFKK